MIDFLREDGIWGKFAVSKKINVQGQRTKYQGQHRTEISLYNPLNPRLKLIYYGYKY